MQQSHGYEEGHNGELVRQHGNNMGYKGTPTDSVGPNVYFEVDYSSSLQPRRNHSFFSSTTQREIFHIDSNPGPGRYKAALEEKSSRNFSSVFNSTTDRPSLVPLERLKMPNLGPGIYTSKDSFSDLLSKDQKLKKEKKRVLPFGSTAPRLESPNKIAEVPGPGAYYKADLEIEKSKSHSAFNAKARRFKDRQPEKLGPGSYIDTDAQGLVEGLSQKTRGAYGIFGSTSSRFGPHGQTKSPSAPPPGTYEAKDAFDVVLKPDKRSHQFQSKTRRSAGTSKRSAPPVGLYTIDTGNWGKKSFHVDKKGIGFSSSTKR